MMLLHCQHNPEDPGCATIRSGSASDSNQSSSSSSTKDSKPEGKQKKSRNPIKAVGRFFRGLRKGKDKE
jgi:hypothetical protein